MRKAADAKRNRRMGRESGAELVEFALALPLLLILLVGIFDFGAAFALRQKMTNAAREAARILVSNSLSDQSCLTTTPCSVVSAVNSMVDYMNDGGASLSCIQPSSPTTSGTLEWTYTCSNGISIVINCGYAIAGSGGVMIPATEVTFAYPFTWRLAPFLPGYSSGATLATQVTMANLAN